MPCTHAAYLRAAAECRTPCDAVALAADPSLGLSYEALLSICAARLVAATKASMGRHRAKAAAITQRYEGGAHLVAIASELDLPPTMLARVVLEERYSLRKGAKGRHGAGALLRSPSLIDDPRLRSEVAAAVASDAAYGPAVDAARAADWPASCEERLFTLSGRTGAPADRAAAGACAITGAARAWHPLPLRGAAARERRGQDARRAAAGPVAGSGPPGAQVSTPPPLPTSISACRSAAGLFRFTGSTPRPRLATQHRTQVSRRAAAVPATSLAAAATTVPAAAPTPAVPSPSQPAPPQPPPPHRRRRPQSTPRRSSRVTSTGTRRGWCFTGSASTRRSTTATTSCCSTPSPTTAS